VIDVGKITNTNDFLKTLNFQVQTGEDENLLPGTFLKTLIPEIDTKEILSQVMSEINTKF
jgi:hypothetical protein